MSIRLTSDIPSNNGFKVKVGEVTLFTWNIAGENTEPKSSTTWKLCNGTSPVFATLNVYSILYVPSLLLTGPLVSCLAIPIPGFSVNDTGVGCELLPGFPSLSGSTSVPF